MGITVTGQWHSLPTKPAEQIRGAEIFKRLCSQQGRWELAERELAVTFMKDGQEYAIPRLWLRWDQSGEVTPGAVVPCLKLVFVSIPAPWLASMEFYCDPVDGQTAASNGVSTLKCGALRWST